MAKNRRAKKLSLPLMNTNKTFGIMASGAGSNFIALHKKSLQGELPAQIAFLITNNSQCGAAEYARGVNIPVYHISAKTHPDYAQLAQTMVQVILNHGISLLVLAGYMKKIPNEVLACLPGAVLNIHPSLLPKFGGSGLYGMNVHKAVLEAKELVSGATVHFVTANYDEGQIAAQAQVAVLPQDTPETLAQRVQQQEHDLYWKVIRDFFRGTVSSC
jgi:phosphoribosylglycinamide formyltransferase 1